MNNSWYFIKVLNFYSDDTFIEILFLYFDIKLFRYLFDLYTSWTSYFLEDNIEFSECKLFIFFKNYTVSAKNFWSFLPLHLHPLNIKIKFSPTPQNFKYFFHHSPRLQNIKLKIFTFHHAPKILNWS